MNIVLRKILGDYVRRFYFFTDREEIEYYKIIVKGVDTAEPGDYVKTLSLMKKDDLIIRDLFLWAILHNHIDMAKVFLAYMPYRICAALIATDILRKFHSKANYGDLKDAYLAGAGYFENYAIACINQCEKNDANMACEIVLQEIDFFGNATCLQVGPSFLRSLRKTYFRWRSMHRINHSFPGPVVCKQSIMSGMTRLIQVTLKGLIGFVLPGGFCHLDFLRPRWSTIEKKRSVAVDVRT